MFRLASQRTSRILTSQRHSFSVFRSLVHLLRGYLNKIRWEQNHEFRAVQQRNSTVPRNTQQANQLFIQTQKDAALSQQQRMKRIDLILGTNTHFHEGKIFHERIDSDHLMEVEYLKRQNPEKTRQTLNWLNPQADVKIKYKNKKKYYDQVSKLRVYPLHKPQNLNLADDTNKSTIQFLANQTAYTAISLKPVELTMASLEQESFFLPPEKPFSTKKYCYFRPQFTMQLLRVSKVPLAQNLYNSSLLNDETAIEALGSAVEEVISLDQIYNALKDFDTDERVHEYLRKVQNNRVQYLFSALSFDQNEDTVAIILDILDDGIEHCLLVKSLVSPDRVLQPIFNLKPEVVFSSDGRDIFYIQRSQEGGWIQLVKRKVESCWGKNQIIISDNQEAVYRCEPDKELKLGKDADGKCTFVAISDYGKKYSQKLFMISSSEQIQLIPVDQDGMCQYIYNMCPQGLVVCRKRQVESGSIKYGNNKYYIQSVELVPFKQHLQIRADNIGMTDLLPGQVKQLGVTPQELDFDGKRCIFTPNQHEFITQVEVRKTHIVMVINYFSIYDKACLYFLPFKGTSHPHSLILRGGAQIKLRSANYVADSQIIQYSHPQGPLLEDKVYNIWKRQLRQDQAEASRYHHQIFTLNEEGDYPIDLHFSCKSIFLEEKEIPVLLVIMEQGETFDQGVIRQFMEKGVAVIQFNGRGTFSKDLQHFLAGSRHNFNHYFDDLQRTIQFIGNSMTKNISLYCKGQISSLAGLWFNLYFPYLFNSTVLHNGLYDLADDIAIQKRQDFFGSKKSVQEGNPIFDFQRFNVFQHKFRMLHPIESQSEVNNKEKSKFEIGQLQNIIISSAKDKRLHSRKLAKRLRYSEVYLKEHQDPYLTDLYNLSYIYSKIRQRLEREVHQWPQQDNQN